MIKVKQAEWGHWIRADKPVNAIASKPEFAGRRLDWDDVEVVFCDKCLRKITDEIRD